MASRAEKSSSWDRAARVDAICEECSRPFRAVAYYVKKGWGRFCSVACANKNKSYRRNWSRGMFSYKRINSDSQRKELLRDAVGRICQECGKTEADNGRRLDVHRIVRSVKGGQYEEGQVLVLCIACHTSIERDL